MAFTEAQLQAARDNAAHIRAIHAASPLPAHLKDAGYTKCATCGSRNAPNSRRCFSCGTERVR